MKRTLTLLLLAACTILVCAKEPQRPTSYNYQRGVEAINNGDYDEGSEYLERELDDNPKNGYAYAWLASIEMHNDEVGTAIMCLNLALKYIPKSDKYYTAWSLSALGDLYLQLQDTTLALQYYTKAIKAEPDNIDWLRDRGVTYLQMENYDAALADFQKMTQLQPGKILGYIYQGDVYKRLHRYDEAIRLYEYANRLGTRAAIYSRIASVQVEQEQYEKAAVSIIDAFKLSHFDDMALDILAEAKEELCDELHPRIQLQINANPNSVEWRLYQIYLYRDSEEYEKAISATIKVQSLDADPYFDNILADTYRDMGDLPTALQYAIKAYEADTTDMDYLYDCIALYSRLDSCQTALQLADKMINDDPEGRLGYYTRANVHMQCAADYSAAKDDYATIIAIDADDTYARFMRGRMAILLGDTTKANKDFQYVIDSSADAMEKIFSHIFLNNRETAQQLMDSVLQTDTIENAERYNIACCYALLGEDDKAFETIEQELQDGYINFWHIRHDPDFVTIRGERLDSLLAIYEDKVQERIRAFKGDTASEQTEERIVEVPFTAANGVTKVDCTINNLPLNFIFDTGASDVTISQVEANFMFKNGYLSSKDIIGKQHYQTADGNISVGTTIILKEIQFAGLILNDVRASVVKSQNAPLLLGQTVLQRLGKIEIDNTQRILKITTNQ